MSGHVLESSDNICPLDVSLRKFCLVSLDGFNTMFSHVDLGNYLTSNQNVFSVADVVSEHRVALTSSEIVLALKVVEASSVWDKTLERVFRSLNLE